RDCSWSRFPPDRFSRSSFFYSAAPFPASCRTGPLAQSRFLTRIQKTFSVEPGSFSAKRSGSLAAFPLPGSNLFLTHDTIESPAKFVLSRFLLFKGEPPLPISPWRPVSNTCSGFSHKSTWTMNRRGGKVPSWLNVFQKRLFKVSAIRLWRSLTGMSLNFRPLCALPFTRRRASWKPSCWEFIR
ncbi:MAG: hypothetical protein JWM99_1460, partial [Verrucomicrobiales bacterium]|nr:hypothetical protein [Verrucomicrobiales bacterium]